MSQERILFIRGGAVGDFVLTLPLLAALRGAHPEGRIEALGYPRIAELAISAGYADALSRVDAPSVAPIFSSEGSLEPGQRSYFAGFDVTVCVWPDRDGTIERNLRSVGSGKLVMIDPLPPEGSRVHAIDFAADQLEASGIPVRCRTPRVCVSAEDRNWAEALTGENDALLGMHIGSGSAKKNWPGERFLSVAEAWVAEKGGGVLLTAGPAEEGGRKRLRRACPRARGGSFARSRLQESRLRWRGATPTWGMTPA